MRRDSTTSIATCCLAVLLLSTLQHGANAKRKDGKKLPARSELVEKLVEGVKGPDEKGLYFITHEDMPWSVLESKAEDGAPLILFIKTKGFQISYEDPRTGKLIEIPEDIKEAAREAFKLAPPPPPIKLQTDMAAGLPGDAEMDEQGRWYIYDNEDKVHLVHKDATHDRFYFENSETKETSWTDPRRNQPSRPEADDEDDDYEDPDEGEGQKQLGAGKEEL